MKRKAIVIEASQVPKLNDLNGARKDAKNWNNFLLSDLGGVWSSHDIVVLNTPLMSDVLSAISESSVDYLFVAFSGHGGIVDGKEVICLKNGDYPINLLKKMIIEHSPKATLVLDCCRSVDENIDVEIERSVSQFEAQGRTRSIHHDGPVYCRTGTYSFGEKMGMGIPSPSVSVSSFAAAWLASLNNCSEGLVTMWACSRGQGAGENSSETSKAGGYFTTALIKAALNWNRMANTPHLIYKTADAFVDSLQFIHDPQQTPEYEPEWLSFPFAISSY